MGSFLGNWVAQALGEKNLLLQASLGLLVFFILLHTLHLILLNSLFAGKS